MVPGTCDSALEIEQVHPSTEKPDFNRKASLITLSNANGVTPNSRMEVKGHGESRGIGKRDPATEPR